MKLGTLSLEARGLSEVAKCRGLTGSTVIKY